MGAVFLGLVGCAEPSPPLPDHFDTVFVRGQVCLPESVNTETQTHFPVRFIYQLPECVRMADGTAGARLVQVGNELVLVGTASLESDHEQSACDEASLENPPRVSSRFVTADFQLPVPEHEDGSALFGYILVSVPYFTVSEGQDIVDRLNAAEDPADVLIGVVNTPQNDRRINVTFAGEGQPPVEATEFEDSDCHEMIVPVH